MPLSRATRIQSLNHVLCRLATKCVVTQKVLSDHHFCWQTTNGVEMVTARQGGQFAKRLGQAIAAQRLSMGFTQAEVARNVGVDQETISRFERGTTLPSLNRLVDIAELLQVPLDSLVRAGSSRAQDVASDLILMLEKLSPQNRQFVRELAAQLCDKLAEK